MVTPVLRELAGTNLAQPSPGKLLEDVALRLTTAWEKTCHRAITTGNAEELHATRDDYQATLLGYLKILDGWLTVMSRFPGEYSEQSLKAVSLNQEQLQQHYGFLFPRWQTLDDLDAILLERVAIPNERLNSLAAKFPPPSSWYEEAFDESCSLKL
jgi:hypothetical protein